MTKEFGYSAKPFFGQSFSPTGRRTLKLTLFLGSIVSLYLLYKLLALVLPPLFAFLTVLSVIVRILVEISRIITFPGAYWFWRRNTENYFQRAFIKKIQFSVSLLMKLLDYLEQEVAWDNLLTEGELAQIRMMISSLLGLLKKQEEHRTLSKRQRKLSQEITEIEQLLNETQIVNKADQKVFSLWSLLEENSDAQDGLLLPNAQLYYQDRTQGNIIYERCHRLENRFNEITAQKGFFGSLMRWFLEDSFGTIDQVREEISARYECKQVSLQVDKKASLDCLFIAGRSADEINTSTSDIGEQDQKTKGKSNAEIEGDSNYYLQYAAKGTKHLKTTIIICCPHTAYYEYLFYENEWIDVYIRNGLNVFLWNYRGYGRSKGKLDSYILKRDGEFIVDYLRKEMGVKRLGAHGESIGGLVASHLAKNKNLDFLCVDRNFADLNRIGEITYGKFMGALYKYLMMWDEDIGSNYLESSCYKVITFDPKDETIPLMDSLTYSLTSRMITSKENFENEDPANAQSKPSIFKKFKRFRKLQAFNKKIEESIRDYYELLSREQMIALYWALFRISELFEPLSSIQNLPGLAKSKRAKSIDDISAVNKMKNVPIKLKYERRNSLDSSMNMSAVLRENEGDPHNLDDNRPHSPSNRPHSPQNRPHSPNNGANNRKILGTDDSMLNDSKYLNETIDMRGFGQLDDAHLVKTAKRKGYADQFEEDARNSAEVIGLLVKIFTAFEGLEAGGIQVSDVMSLKEEIRFEAFMHFINSFEVWGSYYPLEKIVEDEPKGLTYFQASGLSKLKEFVKRIDLTIQKQKLKPIDRGQNKLVNAVLDDLEIITSVIPSLFQKISMRNEDTSSFVTGEGEKTQDDVQIDIEDASRTKDAVGGKFIALGSHTSRNTDRSQSYAFLGNLLPLGLGHNEALKQEEIEAYEYHLRTSKMI